MIIKEVWDNSDGKTEIVTALLSGLLLLWILNNLIDAIDKTPIVAGMFELVGTFVSIWFIYRFVAFDSDRYHHLNHFFKCFYK